MEGVRFLVLLFRESPIFCHGDAELNNEDIQIKWIKIYFTKTSDNIFHYYLLLSPKKEYNG
jgi:hypothetical protein